MITVHSYFLIACVITFILKSNGFQQLRFSTLTKRVNDKTNILILNSKQNDISANNAIFRNIIKPLWPLIAWYTLANLPIYGIGEFNGKAEGLGSMTNFATLENRLPPPAIANEYIVAPRGVAPFARVVAAPEFSINAERLYKVIDRVVSRQSLITLVAKDFGTLRSEYVQRTPLFRFPDVITIQAIPIDEERSSIAIHSYSIYGASDLGVNAKRVKLFLQEIDKEILSSSKTQT